MQFTFRPAAPTEFPLILSLLKEAAQKLFDKGLDQWNVWLNPKPDKIDWIKQGFDATVFNTLSSFDKGYYYYFNLISNNMNNIMKVIILKLIYVSFGIL